ncbi:DUF3817 domain-containing protein [Pseudonocardia sp. TRM90224]|uniref:DUF3817 domain-containing protein n=1 Tax=Pseudonocardia sp. TRM90224 TaxID=2812678 RepID=UPI001E5A7E0B|nr:DUF3817 domain-containing protein [Pseudonocardia sp. TRM90224]
MSAASDSQPAVALLFRIISIAEACSWAGLLAGMFVKYVLRVSEIGVTVFGPIHGGLFIAYVVITIVAAVTFRWRIGTTLLALAVSIPPLLTLWLERRARRNGLLEAPVVLTKA